MRKITYYLTTLIFALLVTSLFGENTIKITAVGDIMMGTSYPLDYLPEDGGIHLFDSVKPFLSGDIIFGNLEETLNRNCKCIKTVKSGRVYAFRAPQKYAYHLLNAGFNVLSLSNNHSMDFGQCGLNSTKKILKKVGIKFSSKNGETAFFNINNRKIALIAVSFGTPPRSITSPTDIYKEIRELSDKNFLVIISVHNGIEGNRAIHTKNKNEYFYGINRGNVVKFARNAIRYGADLIIGHGPHVPRGMEIIDGKLIMYSLGNFCTYGWISTKGYKGFAPLVQLELTENGDFVKGKIYSFYQKKLVCPQFDIDQKAGKLIKKLSLEDFPKTAPKFIKEKDYFVIRP